VSPAPVIFSAVPTLFSSDGEVDAGANRTLYKFVAGLLDGLLVAGTTGEFPALDDAERLGLIELALAEAGPDRVIAHVGAPDARHSPHLIQQSGEIPSRGRRIAIAVDVLAEQLDLGVSGINRAAGFIEYAGRCATTLLTARVGNHAIGAELVASFDNGDVGTVRIGACGELGVKGLVGLAIIKSGDALVPCFKLHQHLWKIAIARATSNKADIRRALKDLFAFLLGDTSEHGEFLAVFLQFFVFIQPMEDLLLGFVADGTRVVKDEVGGFF